MYVYIVREPFSGFAKGQELSQAQYDAAPASLHLDHHTVRVWRTDPPPAPVPPKPAKGVVADQAPSAA